MIKKIIDVILKIILTGMWGWWCFILLTESYWVALFLMVLLAPITWLLVTVVVALGVKREVPDEG